MAGSGSEYSLQREILGFLQISGWNHAKIAFAFLTLFSLGACLPSGEQDVNTDLFKNKEDMQERAMMLKPGMTKRQVFTQLDIDPEKFTRMGQTDVQTSIYGNSMVQGSPQQLEEFRLKLSKCEGYTLPYKEVKSSRSIGFGTLKVKKTGHDLKMVLVFERDKLIRAQIEGTQDVQQNDDQYIWDFLLNKGVGMAF